MEIDIGVQQGIVLYPILYIIYVAVLGNLKLHGKLFSYVDVTALITSDINWEKSTQNVESDMYKINE